MITRAAHKLFPNASGWAAKITEKCAVHDGIADIFDQILHAGDCLVFGSPVYFSDVTGMMRCFWERLYFSQFCI